MFMLPGIPPTFPMPSGYSWILSCLGFHVKYFVYYYYFFHLEVFQARRSEWNSAVDVIYSQLDLPTLTCFVSPALSLSFVYKYIPLCQLI